MLSPVAFLPLGTSSGRCSAGTRWGSCGSPETGYCTGTWRSSRCPWRRPRGRRDRSHRTSVCSGMPCASPARPFQHSRRLRHRRNGGSTWIVLQAAPFRPPYRSLSDVVRDDGPLPPERVAEAGFQILSALRAADAVGVRHGGIRPGNVLLGPGNWAMLTSFGMVTADDGRAVAGAPAGPPCYLAPERASGQPVTLAADLWSLGAILYAAVEGRPPFHGDGRRRCSPRRQRLSGSAPRRGPALASDQRPARQGRGCPARRRRRRLAAPARGRWPRCRGTAAARPDQGHGRMPSSCLT